MAGSSKGPRAAISPKYRTNPSKAKDEADENQPDILAEEALAPEDSFVLLSTRIADWIVQQKVLIGAVVALAFLLAVGTSLYASHTASREQEVASEFYQASRKMPTVAGAVSVEDAAKFREAAASLDAVAKENDGFRSANMAALYAGYSYLQAGDATEALAAFQTASARVTEPVLKNFAFSGQVAAHSLAGNDQAAVETLKKMTTDLPGVWRESAMMDLGRSLEGMKKADEAVATYEKLLTDHPFSAFADDAKSRLTELKPTSALLTSAEAAPAPPGE